MCAHIQVYVTSFVQELTELLLITVLILKLSMYLSLQNCGQNDFTMQKMRKVTHFSGEYLCAPGLGRQNFTVKFRSITVCFICSHSAIGGLLFPLHYLWV